MSHQCVNCDGPGCRMEPIKGTRYMCIVCKNYDLCGACEARGVHSHHPMVRFAKPVFSTPFEDCQTRSALSAAYKNRKLTSPPPETAAVGAEGGTVLRKEKECVICFASDTCTLFLPCGHMCCCALCASVKKCPLCRAAIKTIMETRDRRS